jgi:hypothetical protein
VLVGPGGIFAYACRVWNSVLKCRHPPGRAGAIVSPRGNIDPPCSAPYPISDDGNGGDCRQNEQVIESTVAPPIIVSMRLHCVWSRNENLVTSSIDSSSMVRRVQAWKTTVCRGVILLYKLLLII